MAVDGDEDASPAQRGVNPAVQAGFRAARPDVVQREGGDDRVAAGKGGAEEAVHDEARATPNPSGGELEDRRIRIDGHDGRPSCTIETPQRERTGACAEVDDRPRGRRNRGRADREHLLVIGDEGPNPRVVLVDGDAEMRRDAHVARDYHTRSEVIWDWGFGICRDWRIARLAPRALGA